MMIAANGQRGAQLFVPIGPSQNSKGFTRPKLSGMDPSEAGGGSGSRTLLHRPHSANLADRILTDLPLRPTGPNLCWWGRRTLPHAGRPRGLPLLGARMAPGEWGASIFAHALG